jgi:signal transduction histidine kinase
MILALPPGETVAVSFRSIDHATRTYLSGELAGEVGTVGATRETTTPRVAECDFILTPDDGRVEVILQYANFHHRRGGDPPKLTVGAPQDLQQMTRQAVFFQTVIAGLLLAAFFYHLTMFLLYAGRRAFLYFALCCLAFAIRAIVPTLIIDRWPTYDWPMLLRADYILMFAGAALFMLFFRSFFPELLSRRVLWTVAALLALYDLAVIPLDTAQSSALLAFVQPLCLVAVVYIAVKLGFSLKRGGLKVGLAFAGIALFLATALNDVLYLNKLPSLGTDLMPAGIAVLTLVYTVILTMDFARTERQLAASRISEERISAEKTALEEQSRMKTEFLQDMSHDLKTPLTVISTEILNAADQLDFEMDTEDMRRSLRGAQREVMRMSRMVDDAVRFASAPGGRAAMETVDLAALLRSAETCRSILAQHGNALVLDVPDRLPGVRGNRDMLLQVMWNLLSNANRHTRDGQITVIASEVGSGVSVTVQDNGEGVTPELLADMFRRGVSAGGTGLGLAICQTVIDLHGGQISARNEPEGGLAVTIVLPIRNVEVVADGE